VLGVIFASGASKRAGVADALVFSFTNRRRLFEEVLLVEDRMKMLMLMMTKEQKREIDPK
jgi:hypothetical protein